jgi:hypothetical protein
MFTATQQERLLSEDQMAVVTTNEDTSLRKKIARIDNDKDFCNHILSFSNEVPRNIAEVKYERHQVSFTFNHLLY